jgi:hypothetical protein
MLRGMVMENVARPLAADLSRPGGIERPRAVSRGGRARLAFRLCFA